MQTIRALDMKNEVGVAIYVDNGMWEARTEI